MTPKVVKPSKPTASFKSSHKKSKKRNASTTSTTTPPNAKKTPRKKEIRPVIAKIPSSRDDSSSNWKALLQKQGKPSPVVSRSRPSKPVSRGEPSPNTAAKKDTKRVRKPSQSDSKMDLSQVPSTSTSSLVSETSSFVTDVVDGDTGSDGDGSAASSQKVKQEFRALGLPESKVEERSRSQPPRHKPTEPLAKASVSRSYKKPPPGGLNDFGFFDYNHYGILRTPLTKEHERYMVDTGIISMDCEMVGVGPMKESALGRVSIVNEYGFCLYDKFVKPRMEVTDYRTQFSGIRENDLRNATPFQVVVKEVSDMLRSHILVGHSLKSDLSVLYLSHSKARTRDTALYFKRILHTRTPKLKTLVKKIVGVDIQQGEHSSVIDAQATMALYQMYQKDWEISVRQSNRGVNILKQTLDELREFRKSSSASAPRPSSNPQHPTSANWYGHEVPNIYPVTIPSVSPLAYNTLPVREDVLQPPPAFNQIFNPQLPQPQPPPLPYYPPLIAPHPYIHGIPVPRPQPSAYPIQHAVNTRTVLQTNF